MDYNRARPRTAVPHDKWPTPSFYFLRTRQDDSHVESAPPDAIAFIAPFATARSKRWSGRQEARVTSALNVVDSPRCSTLASNLISGLA